MNRPDKRGVNGYTWSFFENGIHTFTRKEGDKHSCVECTEGQLSNGDIEFMTKNGWTLSLERKRKEIRRYKNGKKKGAK